MIDDPLRKLAATGASAARIGEALGISKNAVIGRCRRRGIRLLGEFPFRRSIGGRQSPESILRAAITRYESIASRSVTLPKLAWLERKREFELPECESLECEQS